jgi:uncharacterized membrane protein
MMLKKITQLIRTFGVLRLSLVGMVLLDMSLRPIPGTSPDYESTRAVIGMVASAMAPILFMLLLLDGIMTLIYMSSMPLERKRKYRLVLLANLLLAVILLVHWLPYFRALI